MDEKNFYLDTIEQIVPAQREQIMTAFYEFLELEHLYESAAEIVKTQLGIYDNEFSMKFQRNPIHSIESRIKSPQSIVEKLQRKGFPVSAKSAEQHLTDIAGIRVICYYIDDIYAMAELLTMNEAFQVIKVKDYIKNPKPSGYRSLHLVLTVPVCMSTMTRRVPVEIQIRTIAMDFWAALEHQLHYKTSCEVPPSLKQELLECAETIALTDMRMQDIYQQIHELD
ncbi:MAG: GTP pyrophosphokinase family protein [Oscillospiraceae bacterium]|nr:GTP pyrophosphokinase family protein [Ruminococcus sp.]MBQ7003873.1 GTP pyrophosphokinase family protein [Oscillospiraceae bacterium]MBQ7013471.1 GTP pyrophosphokinase family protein [Oscillospiraceae bacterium]